jgi:hypothetical protein
MNKMAQLLDAEPWWDPSRPKLSWSALLDGHFAVVVNTGVTESGVQVQERLSGQMSALLLYGLRAAIQRTCSGWEAAGRSVSLFADELSLLAGTSPEVVSWLRNQGRSYGVRPVFATQYPEQLHPAVRTALMSFSTLFAFAQDAARVAEDLAADFAADGSTWAASDVVNLPQFMAIMRTNVEQARVAPCTVRTFDFEADMAGFRTSQSMDVTAGAR